MTTPTQLPKHSPLGASGAERFIECPGSVGLSAGLENDEDDTFSRPGTVAHALAAVCLETHREPWTFLGWGVDADEEFYEPDDPKGAIAGCVVIDKDMVDNVQRYLDDVQHNHPERHQGDTWIERRFHCPTIHSLFYGTSDLIHLDPDGTLHVWDFKFGAGILVEPEQNAQLMYYACGALEDLGLWPDGADNRKVVLHIHQPRIGWHSDGVHRIWETSALELDVWLYETLVPAMDLALTSTDTKIGKHCRFCPSVGHKCPAIMDAMQEMEKIMQTFAMKTAEKRTPAECGRFRELFAVAKLVAKENDKHIFGFLSAGKDVPGAKLTKAKSDREWKDGAEEKIVAKFGKLAYTEPKLKSPAQIESLPGGEAVAATWAFKPDRGMTVADAKDHRVAIKPQTGKNLFKAVGK